MAFTQTELDSVNAAINSLASGARLVRATYEGKTVEFAQASMTELLSLQARMQVDVARVAGRPRYAVISTSKGL